MSIITYDEKRFQSKPTVKPRFYEVSSTKFPLLLSNLLTGGIFSSSYLKLKTDNRFSYYLYKATRYLEYFLLGIVLLSFISSFRLNSNIGYSKKGRIIEGGFRFLELRKGVASTFGPVYRGGTRCVVGENSNIAQDIYLVALGGDQDPEETQLRFRYEVNLVNQYLDNSLIFRKEPLVAKCMFLIPYGIEQLRIALIKVKDKLQEETIISYLTFVSIVFINIISYSSLLLELFVINPYQFSRLLVDFSDKSTAGLAPFYEDPSNYLSGRGFVFFILTLYLKMILFFILVPILIFYFGSVMASFVGKPRKMYYGVFTFFSQMPYKFQKGFAYLLIIPFFYNDLKEFIYKDRYKSFLETHLEKKMREENLEIRSKYQVKESIKKYFRVHKYDVNNTISSSLLESDLSGFLNLKEYNAVFLNSENKVTIRVPVNTMPSAVAQTYLLDSLGIIVEPESNRNLEEIGNNLEEIDNKQLDPISFIKTLVLYNCITRDGRVTNEFIEDYKVHQNFLEKNKKEEESPEESPFYRGESSPFYREERSLGYRGEESRVYNFPKNLEEERPTQLEISNALRKIYVDNSRTLMSLQLFIRYEKITTTLTRIRKNPYLKQYLSEESYLKLFVKRSIVEFLTILDFFWILQKKISGSVFQFSSLLSLYYIVFKILESNLSGLRSFNSWITSSVLKDHFSLEFHNPLKENPFIDELLGVPTKGYLFQVLTLLNTLKSSFIDLLLELRWRYQEPSLLLDRPFYTGIADDFSLTKIPLKLKGVSQSVDINNRFMYKRYSVADYLPLEKKNDNFLKILKEENVKESLNTVLNRSGENNVLRYRMIIIILMLYLF